MQSRRRYLSLGIDRFRRRGGARGESLTEVKLEDMLQSRPSLEQLNDILRPCQEVSREYLLFFPLQAPEQLQYEVFNLPVANAAARPSS